jgi:diadenosine tetraphosphate (Ap4A) HIT family hydrolase
MSDKDLQRNVSGVCIFCEIAKGTVPASMVFVDEQAAHIFQTAVHIARIIRTVSGCEGLNVVQSNGTVGQQDVFHFHLHLVPRVARDTQQGRIILNWDNTPRERRELDRLAADLRMQIQRHED